MQILYSSAFWLEFLIFKRFAKVPQTPVKDRFSRQRSSNHKPSSHPWSVYPHCLPHWIRVSLKEDPFGKQCKQWHDAQDVLAGIVTARVKKNWRGVFQNLIRETEHAFIMTIVWITMKIVKFVWFWCCDVDPNTGNSISKLSQSCLKKKQRQVSC